MPWIATEGFGGVSRVPPDDGKIVAERDLHFRPETIKRQSLGERVPQGARAVEQQSAILFAHQEIEKNFPLRREQGCVVERCRIHAADIIGDEPLQEVAGRGPGNGDDGAVFEPEIHSVDVVLAPAIAKTGKRPYSSTFPLSPRPPCLFAYCSSPANSLRTSGASAAMWRNWRGD